MENKVKNNEEITFYRFFVELKSFLKELLNDPINAKPNNFFKDNGISKNALVNRMIDRGILNKKEDIGEKMLEDGKLESIHTLQYKIPKRNFERKIRRLYTYFFE